jgi:hypothetical protein
MSKPVSNSSKLFSVRIPNDLASAIVTYGKAHNLIARTGEVNMSEALIALITKGLEVSYTVSQSHTVYDNQSNTLYDNLLEAKLEALEAKVNTLSDTLSYTVRQADLQALESKLTNLIKPQSNQTQPIKPTKELVKPTKELVKPEKETQAGSAASHWLTCSDAYKIATANGCDRGYDGFRAIQTTRTAIRTYASYGLLFDPDRDQDLPPKAEKRKWQKLETTRP